MPPQSAALESASADNLRGKDETGSERIGNPATCRATWSRGDPRNVVMGQRRTRRSPESTTQQRKARHALVNAANIPQMDSNTHLLEDRRVLDRFYLANWDVLQADFYADLNAYLNLLHRYSDQEVILSTLHREVRRIVLARSPAQLSVKVHELLVTQISYQPCANKSKDSEQLCSGFWKQVTNFVNIDQLRTWNQDDCFSSKDKPSSKDKFCQGNLCSHQTFRVLVKGHLIKEEFGIAGSANSEYRLRRATALGGHRQALLWCR